MQVTIPVRFLAAALHFVAVRDVRYYLQGVLIDPIGAVVATDGHVAVVCKLAPGTLPADFPAIVLPSAQVKEIVTAAKSFKTITLEVTPATDKTTAHKVEVIGGFRVAPFLTIDCKFPDWTRIYPTLCNGEPASLDAVLFARFAKARAAMGIKSSESGIFTTYANGQNCHVGVLADDVHALIAPLRENISKPASEYEPLAFEV